MGGAPAIATEWSVEARGRAVRRVRIVLSLFAGTDNMRSVASFAGTEAEAWDALAAGSGLDG